MLHLLQHVKLERHNAWRSMPVFLLPLHLQRLYVAEAGPRGAQE